MEVGPDEVTLGETIGCRRLHSVESLAREWRLDPWTLRKVLAAKGLAPVSAVTEGYHLLDAEAGDAAAASVKRAVHVVSMPKVLNCSRPQFDQLLQERVLIPLSGGRNIALGQRQKGIDYDQVAAFLEALHGAARPVATAPEGFVPIAKAADKAKIPCIDIVHMLLAGFLETAVRLTRLEGHAAIQVDPTELTAKMRSRMPGLSASAVAEALSLLPADLWALVDRTCEPCLGSIIVEGATGHRFHRFEPAAVEDFRARFVSERGLAASIGIPGSKLASKLRSAEVQAVLAPPEMIVELYRIEDLPTSLRPPAT